MRIRFTRDEIYENEGVGKGPKFAKDEVIDARDDFAQRWIHRGAAHPAKGGKGVDLGDDLFRRVEPDSPAAGSDTTPGAGSDSLADAGSDTIPGAGSDSLAGSPADSASAKPRGK